MKWAVIYSFDLIDGTSVKSFTPINGRWKLTEGDEEYDCFFNKGKHRKYIAVLSDKVFRRFLENTLYPYHVENTAGMIGVIDYGCMPAWCLSPDDYPPGAVSKDAFVCPLDETDKEAEFLKNMSSEEIAKWIKEEYIN